MAHTLLLSFVGRRCLVFLSHLLLLRELLPSRLTNYVCVASAFNTAPAAITVTASLDRKRHFSPFRSRCCKDQSHVVLLCAGHESATTAEESGALETVIPEKGMEVKPSGREVVEAATARLHPVFAEVDRHTQRTLGRILDAFRDFRVGASTFAGVDGYGHGDMGRETLDKVYARLFGAEAALVRVQCFSGTHAIACCLFGVLRPGDTMLACSGRPYDTLDEVIGTRAPMNDEYGDESDLLPEPLIGNLKEFHISYKEVYLMSGGVFDLGAIDEAIEADPNVKLLHVQRSCGYRWRPSIPIQEIERLCAHVRDRWGSKRDLVIFVDNCYGEFVEDREPCHVGADLVAGSLIKNPGGTLAKSGGYVAGKRNLVRAAANRLSAPGVAGGATLGQNQNLFQGLFLAPTIVGESLKGAFLLADVFGTELGLPTNPPPPSTLAPTGDGNPGSGTAFSVTETRSKTPNPSGLETRLSTPSWNGNLGSSTSAESGTRSSTPPGLGNPESGTSAVATKFSETTPLGNPDRRCYGGGVGGRTDIVQAIELGDRSRLVKFCEVVQRFSPVDAFVNPVPGVTAGYGDEVIFADGTFVDGSTLELSADGPLRPPFIAFAQGCTHWTHWALILEEALSDTGLLDDL